jgi:alpha-tubulin suppressor-like RCC1 family protein
MGSDHACAARSSSGDVVCWGRNVEGQLGDATKIQRDRPVPVPGITAVTSSLTAHASHTCAVRGDDRSVWCWGGSGFTNEVGPGGPTTVPRQVASLSAIAVSAGQDHTCAVLTSGDVSCWGNDNYSQLGNGAAGSTATPSPPIGLSEVVQLASGVFHTCSLTATGSVFCWGANGYGALGNPIGNDLAVPTPVAGISGVVEIAAALDTTCARTGAGQIYCFGSNDFGELGNNTAPGASDATPQFTGIDDAISLDGGGYNVCAVRAGGQLWCWGNNECAQLGPDAPVTTLAPLQMDGVTDAAIVRVGRYHICYVNVIGEIYCSGDNSRGALGNGSLTPTCGDASGWSRVLPP